MFLALLGVVPLRNEEVGVSCLFLILGIMEKKMKTTITGLYRV